MSSRRRDSNTDDLHCISFSRALEIHKLSSSIDCLDEAYLLELCAQSILLAREIVDESTLT